jgi:enamine deaminase RidA (YjgF/YER057c/UK114 family)
MKIHNSNTVAAPGGPYRHGIETPPNARWLHIAGQIGVAPEDFDGQADQCWRNIKAILAAAGMGVENLVKVTHFLTRAEDIAAYGRVRSRHLGEPRPASTLLVINALARPGLLVEVEAIAAKA